MLKNRVGCALALGFVLCIAWASRPSANEEFPFGRELLLDALPMKGSKRIPGIEIDVGWHGRNRPVVQHRARPGRRQRRCHHDFDR